LTLESRPGPNYKPDSGQDPNTKQNPQSFPKPEFPRKNTKKSKEALPLKKNRIMIKIICSFKLLNIKMKQKIYKIYLFNPLKIAN